MARVCDNGLHVGPSDGELRAVRLRTEPDPGSEWWGDIDLCQPCLDALLERDWSKLEQLRNPKPTRAPRKGTGTRKAAARKPGPGMKAPPTTLPDAEGWVEPIPTPGGP